MKSILFILASAVAILILTITIVAEHSPIETDNHSNREKGGDAAYSSSKGHEPASFLQKSDRKLDKINLIPKSQNLSQTDKNEVLLSLYDASFSPSKESVQLIEYFLLSSDLDIRDAAIEAMKQLSTPEAARALRSAASKSTIPLDQAAFLKAAEFVDLPDYMPQK